MRSATASPRFFWWFALTVFVQWNSSSPAMGASGFSSLSIYACTGGYSPSQPNVTAGLESAGYRATSSPFGIFATPASVSAHAPVEMVYPGSCLGAAYRLASRLAIQSEYTVSRERTSEYVNILHADTSNDRLRIRLRASSVNLLGCYVVRPYPARKTVGVALTASAGVSVCTVRERMDARLPVADSAMAPSVVDLAAAHSAGGFSALFGFEAEVFIGKHFSVTPARIVWCLSVIRPSFEELKFQYEGTRRVLPSRNYDLTGLYWQVGASYHF